MGGWINIEPDHIVQLLGERHVICQPEITPPVNKTG